jgi:hypothetical protein
MSSFPSLGARKKTKTIKSDFHYSRSVHGLEVHRLSCQETTVLGAAQRGRVELRFPECTGSSCHQQPLSQS